MVKVSRLELCAHIPSCRRLQLQPCPSWLTMPSAMHTMQRRHAAALPFSPVVVWAALLAAHLCALPRAASAARPDLAAATGSALPPQLAGGVAAYVAIALLALAVVAALLALVGIKQDRQQGGWAQGAYCCAAQGGCAESWAAVAPPAAS